MDRSHSRPSVYNFDSLIEIGPVQRILLFARQSERRESRFCDLGGACSFGRSNAVAVCLFVFVEAVSRPDPGHIVLQNCNFCLLPVGRRFGFKTTSTETQLLTSGRRGSCFCDLDKIFEKRSNVTDHAKAKSSNQKGSRKLQKTVSASSTRSSACSSPILKIPTRGTPSGSAARSGFSEPSRQTKRGAENRQKSYRLRRRVARLLVVRFQKFQRVALR